MQSRICLKNFIATLCWENLVATGKLKKCNARLKIWQERAFPFSDTTGIPLMFYGARQRILYAVAHSRWLSTWMILKMRRYYWTGNIQNLSYGSTTTIFSNILFQSSNRSALKWHSILPIRQFPALAVFPGFFAREKLLIR